MPILPNDTLSSVVNLVNRANSDPVVRPPLSRAAFTLDSSGVAGFFGGESAVRAMGTAYLIPKRRWLGWYNAPGAYEIAKQYSGLAKSHLFNALFPAGDRDPAKILMVDGQVGPEYTQLYSPTGKTPSSIGHLGSLITRKVSQMPVTVLKSGTKGTMDARVAFVKLRRIPGELDKLELIPSSSIIFTVITIIISVGGCIACALVADWFSFASISLGIIANGVACSVIGSGKLYLRHNPPAPSQVDTPGDVLLRTDANIIFLVGSEGMVRPFTHGRFVLGFGEMPSFRPEEVQSSSDVHDVRADGTTVKRNGNKRNTPKANHLSIPKVFFPRIFQKCLTVDISVILLLLQFLAQLLLIPQGTLFGQLMFIGTLLPSWIYHSYLSTLGLELQTQVLFQKLSIQEDSDIFQYQLNTWTQAVVFACLVLRSIHPPMCLSSSTKVAKRTAEDVLAAEMAKDEEEDKERKLKDEKKKKLNAMKEALEAKAKAEKNVVDMAKAEEIASNGAKIVRNEVHMAMLEVDKAEAAVKEAKGKKEEKAANEALIKMKEVVVEKESEAMKKEEELKRKSLMVQMATDIANMAATSAKKAAAAVEKEEFKKEEDEEQEAKKKQDADRMAQQREKGDNALQALLNALLPGQTEVLRAFKESLMRKLSSANNKADWDNMEHEGTFKFNATTQDTSASVQGGKSFRMLDANDVGQLEVYQRDADIAFTIWKREKVGEIAQELHY